MELVETWCPIVFLSILSIALVTGWSQGIPARSISPELRSQIERLSPTSDASWMDKIVHSVPYTSFLLFLYEVLDNLPLNTPTFSMNVFWTVSVLAVSHVAQDELLSTYDNQLAHGNVSPQQCHFESRSEERRVG